MSLWSRISNAVRGERLNREIDEELQSHLEEAIAAGRDSTEARRALGSVLHSREASHRIRAAEWLESFLADVRFGWRQLCRNKVASAAAVLSLAMGIGSCVAAFSLIDALLWRPLPISHPGHLYSLSRQMTGLYGKPLEDDHWATPELYVMRDAVKDQADVIGISDADRTDLTWSTDEDMEKAHVVYASGNMFPVFGLEPTLGRLLAPADDRSGAGTPYAVLSWDYWNRRFGGDPHIIGRLLHLDGQIFEVIGVGPRDFTGTQKGTVADIFLPLSMNKMVTEQNLSWNHIFLMLKPGVDPATALDGASPAPAPARAGDPLDAIDGGQLGHGEAEVQRQEDGAGAGAREQQRQLQLVVQAETRDTLARRDAPGAAQMPPHPLDASPQRSIVGLFRFIANATPQRQPLRRGACVTGKRFYKRRQLVLRNKTDGETRGRRPLRDGLRPCDPCAPPTSLLR